MRPSDGGTHVLIDPSTLKASAGRLKGAGAELQAVQSALGDLVVPDLPPGVAGVVQNALHTAGLSLAGDPQLLESAVTELTRRAFLAEYADRMMGGYQLTGTARKEFVAWMKDGTLLQYADATEGQAAGRELAKLYKGFRDAPRQLIDLARCLKGAEQWGDTDVEQAFGAGFVNEFGARNMELVPRVIQAMEWSRALSGDMGSLDPHLLRDVAARWDGEDLHENPLADLLAPFSIALANATASGQLTRTTEDAIANDPDTWATAALLSSGQFSKQFLLKVFKTGVVDKIAQDSVYDSGLGEAPHDAPYSLGRLWSEDKGGLPYDSKQIVLDALARNPEAAAAALTQQLDGVEASDRFGQRQEVSDPLDLLYKYGHFDDDGAAFGHAYAAATDHLNADPHDAAAHHQGLELTQHSLNLIVSSDHDGMSSFKDGLATDLAHHHIGELFDSALTNHQGGPIRLVDGTALGIPQDTLTTVFQRLGDHPSSLSTVLHSAAIYQGALIHDGTAAGPDAPPVWAYKAGAFDATVLNAADLQRLDDFNADDERHKLVAGFFKAAVNDVIAVENPIASAVLHTGVDATIDHAFPGPDSTKLITDNANAKAFVTNSLHASIAAGYYENGHLHGTQPPASIISGNSLISYGDARGDALWHYEQWLNGDPHVEQVSREALQEAARGFHDHDIDLLR
jgi:hypothetical protein